MIADGICHFLSGPKRAEVVDTAQGIGSIECNIVGVVLHPIENTALGGVPTAGDPAKGDRPFDPRPHRAQPCIVSREFPIQVGVHDLAHMPIGRGNLVACFSVRKNLARTNRSLVIF